MNKAFCFFIVLMWRVDWCIYHGKWIAQLVGWHWLAGCASLLLSLFLSISHAVCLSVYPSVCLLLPSLSLHRFFTLPLSFSPVSLSHFLILYSSPHTNIHYTGACIHVQAHTHTHTCTRVGAWAHLRTHIHTHSYTYTHTHTHTHTHTCEHHWSSVSIRQLSSWPVSLTVMAIQLPGWPNGKVFSPRTRDPGIDPHFVQ